MKYQVEQEMNRLDLNSNPPSSPELQSGELAVCDCPSAAETSDFSSCVLDHNRFSEAVTGKHLTPNGTGDFVNENDGINLGMDIEGVITAIVRVGASELFISGTSESLVNAAKEVLEEFIGIKAKIE
jgi:hypothetical protein